MVNENVKMGQPLHSSSGDGSLTIREETLILALVNLHTFFD